MRQLWSTHPEDAKRLDTDGLRERFLLDGLFEVGKCTWAYSHDDRLMVGGVQLDGGSVELDAPEEIRASYLCERREAGLVGLGGDVVVALDGEEFSLGHHDVVYVPMGTQKVELSGTGKVYIVTAPAHRACAAAKAGRDEVEALHLGEQEAGNVRTIRKYIHADGIESNQLVLGITTLEPGSVWNTMPLHLHSRRTEIYLYDGLGDGFISHLMGRPDELRQIIMRDGDAIVSPPWSVHGGSATQAYTFVWAMAGENIDYTDVEGVSYEDMR